MFQKNHSLGLTGEIMINENGDRELDYTLSDFNPETGIMQPILTYFGRRRKLDRVAGVEVHWPSSKGLPMDVPHCGYFGDAKHCLNLGLFIQL